MTAPPIQKLKDGARCVVIAGTHAGKSGVVKDIKTSKTGAVTITVVQADGERFKTLGKNVEVAGPLLIQKHRIYTMSVARVYPLYIAKVEKKGRTKAEVDEIIRWLTGYSQKKLEAQLAKETNFETFFADAPAMNPSRSLITGVVCGVRVEEITEPTMREIRYLDKLIDELAKGKAMEKILRK